MFFDLLAVLFSKIFFFTGLVQNKGTFPKPLSPQDEKKYLALARQGDSEAKEKLIKHNMRLVAHVVKKYTGAAETDDLISVGSIGLIKAVNSFSPDKNIKLATYASRCIENEILMYLRRMVRLRCEVSLDEPLNIDWEGNELLMSDILGTEPDLVSKNIENTVEKQLLWNAISKLGNREKEIMKMRFGLSGRQEKTQKEVADLLGISQSYISRLEKKIIGRLKKEIVKTL